MVDNSNGGDKVTGDGVEGEKEVPREGLCVHGTKEDIALARAMGFIVEDNNNPVPGNLPAPGEDIGEEGQTWGWSGADHRVIFGASNCRPKLPGLGGSIKFIISTGLFLLFVPRIFLENVIVKQININLTKNMDLSEMLVFIGLWLVISYALSKRERVLVFNAA